jgi:hypothetical protein
VRQIVGIVFVVLGIGMWMCHWEGMAASLPEGTGANRWVRTADGWERKKAWHVDVVPPPPLHPLIVAAGEGLISVFALVAFSNTRNGGRKMQGAE